MKQIENKNILEFDADAFIIPDKLSSIDKNHYKFEYLNKISLMNGCGELGSDDMLVRLWFVSEDLDTVNLVDNGGSCLDVNGNEIIIYPEIGCLPVSLFYDAREYDNVLIRIPYDCGSEEIELHISVKISQTSYRYNNYGRFEEVLRKLMDDNASKKKYATTSCEAMYMEN